jgi:hypothetical protein
LLTADNYAVGCVVTVQPVLDSDTRDEHATIAISDKANALGSRTVDVGVDDLDVVSLVVSSPRDPLTVSETSSATFTVSLNADPTDKTVVNLSPSLADQVTVSPLAISFNSSSDISDWGNPQTITVTGLKDTDLVNHAFTIAVSSAGIGYTAVNVLKVSTPVVTPPPGAGGASGAGGGSGGSGGISTGGASGTGGSAAGGATGSGGDSTGGATGSGGAASGGATGLGGDAAGGVVGSGGSAGTAAGGDVAGAGGTPGTATDGGAGGGGGM